MNIVETYDGSSIDTRQFIGGEERDEADELVRQSFFRGEIINEIHYFYFYDHLDSVRVITDDTGDMQCEYGFSPSGLKTTFCESSLSEFQFAGLFFHARSELNLSVTRLYDAMLGRWSSRDPIEEAGGQNLFAYVFNAMTMDVDPFGLQSAIPSWYDPGSGSLASPTSMIPISIPDIPFFIPPLAPPPGTPIVPMWLPPTVPSGSPHGRRSPRRSRPGNGPKRPRQCPLDNCDPPIARNPHWARFQCWTWCSLHCEDYILGLRWSHCMNRCNDLPFFGGPPPNFPKPPHPGFPPYRPRQ